MKKALPSPTQVGTMSPTMVSHVREVSSTSRDHLGLMKLLEKLKPAVLMALEAPEFWINTQKHRCRELLCLQDEARNKAFSVL